jgi:tetratricopeptide (TPR) repeat protein
LSAVAALDLAEAALATALGQSKAAHALAERALARYAELDDPLPIAQARHLVGRALVDLGDVDEGEVRLTEALAEARALEAPRVTGDVLQSLAIARNAVGDVAGARSLFVQALATSRAVGAENVVANLAGNLAEAEFHGGNAAEALHLEREALANYRGVNNALGVAIALSNIAAYFSALERYDEARVSGREGLAAARDAQWEAGVAWGLQHLAAVGALRSSGELEQRHTDCLRAAHLLGYIDARLEVLDALRGYTEQQEYDKTLTALRDTLDADNLSKLAAEGSTWSEVQAVAEAMLI